MGQRQRRPVDRKTLKVWLPWQLHAEFDKWCVRAGSSMQYAVRAAVEKLVGYKAPPEESMPSFAVATQAPVTPVTKPAPIEEPEWEEPFDPDNEMDCLVRDGGWFPESAAAVRLMCLRHGRLGWKPMKYPEKFLSEYRERALSAGRDFDKDLEVFK